MAFKDRIKIFNDLEKVRGDRTLVCFFNFDRHSQPSLSGLSTQFHYDTKEVLFRVFKESNITRGIDLFFYTRGGDTNSVWPIVSLIREFDPDFQVLIPFRCHSSGTLLALGAKKIILCPLSELSPIDPSTGNQFNPRDPANTKVPLAISVEDVKAYQDFIYDQLGKEKKELDNEDIQNILPLFEELVKKVHPLALGNVYRVLIQIQQLATNLLELHTNNDEKVEEIVEALTTKFYSHLHMINRHEAKNILLNRVEFAQDDLAHKMDKLLRNYENTFNLREKFFLSDYLGEKQQKKVRFIGGAIESKNWSYLFETKAIIKQYSKIKSNIQLQIPQGQPMPLVPGLPRDFNIDIKSQGWIHNKEPKGVTK